MRTAFLKTLEAMAATDPRIMLVVGDLGFTVVEPFAKRFPKQFLNAGVAEQNMTGLSAGLALSGKIVFTYSIANFPVLRCLEQIRNDGCYHKANLKVVSIGGGYVYGALGSSHHGSEDLAIMRALPEMTVVAPGDPLEVECAVKEIIQHQGPCYLRLGKAGEPRVHADAITFQLGKAIPFSVGADITLISTGGLLHSCVQASVALKQLGIQAGVLSMHTLKPLDREAILQAVSQSSAIMTVEEHSVIGGLGGAVAEVLAQEAPRRIPFKIFGAPDGFAKVVGGQEYLRRSLSLSVEDIVRSAKTLLESGQSNPHN